MVGEEALRLAKALIKFVKTCDECVIRLAGAYDMAGYYQYNIQEQSINRRRHVSHHRGTFTSQPIKVKFSWRRVFLHLNVCSLRLIAPGGCPLLCVSPGDPGGLW